jgi:hypothetical protein
MLELYVLKPATLLDSWSEIVEPGKYALKSKPQCEIIFCGFNGYYSLAHRDLDLTYQFPLWTHVKTTKVKQTKNWRTIEAAIRYIEKDMTAYWEAHENAQNE